MLTFIFSSFYKERRSIFIFLVSLLLLIPSVSFAKFTKNEAKDFCLKQTENSFNQAQKFIDGKEDIIFEHIQQLEKDPKKLRIFQNDIVSVLSKTSKTHGKKSRISLCINLLNVFDKYGLSIIN